MSSLLTTTLSVFTIIGQVGLVAGLIALFVKGPNGEPNLLIKLIHRFGLWIILLISLSGTLLSLYYSNIVGLEPCLLCWWQRVFLYPQVIIAIIAIWRKDHGVFIYTFWLSLIGAVIAGYQSLLQMGIAEGSVCLNSETAVSCSKVYFMEFGYITLPMMAFTAFLIALAVSAVAYKVSQRI